MAETQLLRLLIFPSEKTWKVAALLQERWGCGRGRRQELLAQRRGQRLGYGGPRTRSRRPLHTRMRAKTKGLKYLQCDQ